MTYVFDCVKLDSGYGYTTFEYSEREEKRSMKLFAPNYYPKFKCIADKCKHSCCIGWEIDIDDVTAERYETVSGELGKRLKRGISFDGGFPHFVTDEKDRCPFLNKSGLCDIISELGEEALCDICREHPRFRNYFSDRTEVGLGLSCEEAARIILLNDEKAELIQLECCSDSGEEEASSDEQEFFEIRNQLFRILQDRSRSVFDRMERCGEYIGAQKEPPSREQLKALFSGLEYMDGDVCSEILDAIDGADGMRETEISGTILEQAIVYFVYRYLADGLYGGDIAERFYLCVLNTEMLALLWERYRRRVGALAPEVAVEIARRYSAEIEYSEDNIQDILDFLTEIIN